MMRRTNPTGWRHLWVIVLIVGMMTIAGCGNNDSAINDETIDVAERAWARIVPQEGTGTAYGIPLSLSNTQQFIDWYYNTDLTPAQEGFRDNALQVLVAPCCDKYPMSTCCCECNLSRSVWGLSSYLIGEKGYKQAEILREAVLQWLRFIRPDYYVAVSLEDQGENLQKFGLTTASSCFTDRCELPFHTENDFRHLGGCGGMDELVLADTD